MKKFNKKFYMLMIIALIMLILGMTLPIAFAVMFEGYNWSPTIWNILQLGGLGGAIIFGLLYRLTKPKSKE